MSEIFLNNNINTKFNEAYKEICLPDAQMHQCHFEYIEIHPNNFLDTLLSCHLTMIAILESRYCKLGAFA
jgi:hypothetical protein